MRPTSVVLPAPFEGDPVERGPQPPALGGEGHVVVDGELPVDAGDLERVDDAEERPLPGPEPRDVATRQTHLALRRPEAAADEADQCRLAGAVRADQRPHLAAVQPEIDAADGLEAAEALRDSPGLEQGGHGSHAAHRARIPPTMPAGAQRVMTTRAAPTTRR